jgi:phosphoribosylformylglycinamidine synthase II
MTEPAITPELVAKHNLTPDEYAHAKQILGREPSYTELGIFSVMWSEHCSYKNTRPLLKTFPTKSKKILVGAGEENAGIIDIGDGLAIAFKIESHNHPSAVEPFQGAATGVGGIVRDIFTMGARPICSVNSLRFGPIVNDVAADASPLTSNSGKDQSRLTSAATEKNGAQSQIANNRRLFAGVVAGIAHYGNCFGIPTIAGEVYFDKSYEGNPLVNAFCLGVLRHEQIARGAAKGIGNPVFYVGPATGRDGLAGAAFASQDLTEESAEKQRGAVQVGDPFMEKLVCEACLELLATGAVAGIQDMGAAGLTCSTCETAARAGTGIEIELDKVPQRAPNMTSYDLMLSESQERMLIIVHKGREEEVKRIFDKWDLPWSEVGIVTDTGRMVVKHHGQVVADIPAKKIADESPVYQRDSKEPEYLKAVRAFRLDQIPQTQDAKADLLKLLAWPTIASKNWVYRQYDHMVRDGSVVCPGSDAAVLRIKADSLPEVGRAGLPPSQDAQQRVPTVPEKLIALTVDCNGAYVYLDPYEGARRRWPRRAAIWPVPARCHWARPTISTWPVRSSRNCSGRSRNPCAAWRMPARRSTRPSPAAIARSTTKARPARLIPRQPSPSSASSKNRSTSRRSGSRTKATRSSCWAISWTKTIRCWDSAARRICRSFTVKKTARRRAAIWKPAKTLHTTLLGLIQSGLVKSAHDCSEGGLAVCLAESCISQLVARETPRLIGAQIDLSVVATVS